MEGIDWYTSHIGIKQGTRYPLKEAIRSILPSNWGVVFCGNYISTTHKINKEQAAILTGFGEGLIYSGFFDRLLEEICEEKEES